MNIVYLIGLLLAIFFVFFGISVNMDGLIPSIELGNLQNFFDVPSILITIGGTLAVMVACYPKLAKSFPKHIEIMLRAKAFNPTIYVDQLTELAQIARKNGLLALEEKANEQDDPFFKQAIMLIVDANDPDRVRSILENDIEQTSARHQEVVAMYERGSNAAPAFGMIGTLIGLINMLKSLDGAEMNSLGPSMSVALVTTFYGSILAHVIFNPIAANLTARDEEEILCRQIIVEGIMAIQSGEIVPGDIIVIRYEGCKGAPGMKELMLSIDALIGLGLHKSVGLISDARFSGFNFGAIIGHVSPEAYDGGNIALVENGDEIVIDIPGGEVSLLVSEEELQERRKRWVCPPLKEEKGCLNLFARLCRPAEEGGAMQPWDLDAKFHR